MCRQSDSLPRSFIFSLLKVPCFPGGPPTGDQTSSKGQDKADIASLPHPSSLYLALRPRLALGGAEVLPLSGIAWQTLMSQWLTSKCLISLHSSHLEGSEEAGVLVCLVVRWPFISGGRIQESHRSTAQPWGFSHVGHGFYSALWCSHGVVVGWQIA